MNLRSHWLPQPTGWVFSAKNDFFLFIMPLFVGLVIVLGLDILNFDASSLYNIGGVHIYARVTWIDWLFTALLDAPHAFSTGYRVFSDPLQLRKQWRLYLGLPLIVILTLIFAFRVSELWTFRLIK